MNIVGILGKGTAGWNDMSGSCSWSDPKVSAWSSTDSCSSEGGGDCSHEDFFIALGILMTLNYWILLGLLRIWQGLFQGLISKVLNTLCIWYSGNFSRYIPGESLEVSYCKLWGEVLLPLGVSRTSWCWCNSSVYVNKTLTTSQSYSIQRWWGSLSRRCINILLTPCYGLGCYA